MLIKYKKIKYTFGVIFIMALSLPIISFAQVMQSSSYQIQFDSVNSGGSQATSASYKLEDTGGEIGTGNPTSTNYDLDAGYQQQVASVVASLVTPVQSSSGGGGGGGILSAKVPLNITNIKIVPGFSSVVVMWTTNKPTGTKLSFGKTDKYEMGTFSSEEKKTSHTVSIDNLSPSSKYFFKIDLVGTDGQEVSFFGKEFNTLYLPSFELPANVKNLQVGVAQNNIKLEWSNPADADFDSVIVVRSSSFYPSNPFDGEVVYSGTDEKFYDAVKTPGATHYYTVFTKYKNNNYSSGSIISLTTKKEANTIIPVQKDPFVDLPVSKEKYTLLDKLKFSDFKFSQKNNVSIVRDGSVSVSNDENFKVSIGYDKLPEVLKTIGVTLKHKDDENKIFSFLLRVNKDKTAYEAVIAPIDDAGKYDAHISILDFENQLAKKVDGAVMVSSASEVINIESMTVGDMIIYTMIFIAFILFLVFVKKFWMI